MADGEGLQKQVLEMMRAADYQARTKTELAKDLGLKQSQRAEFRSVLSALVAEGTVKRGNRGRYKLKKRDGGLLVGTMKMHSKGSAFFFPDKRDEGNLESGFDMENHRLVFIPSRKTGVALDGDRVTVQVEQINGVPVGGKSGGKKGKGGQKGKGQRRDGSEEGAVGRVVEIIERRSGVVVGTYTKKGKFAYVTPDDPNMPPTIELTGETTANPGQKVSVELLDWDKQHETPRGKVTKVLGYPGEAGVDVLGIIEAHGLRTEFPPEVEDEAKAVPDTIPNEELARREDWRKEFIFTIDPDTAKDFDDAIGVKKTDSGWTLAVHIADVAHYVKPDSPLDEEAVKRGNSTYLVDRVLPMLPPELSNGICSLRPHEDRLTCAAIMRFDKNGKLGEARFEKAVINSQHRLTYAQAQEFIETGKGAVDSRELEEAIKVAWELASLLRKRRFANGALDLEMGEISLDLDDQGKVTGYTVEDYNESHQLIEEFMLIANEAVARAIKNSQRPGIYRIHEDPDFDKLYEYGELARAHGYDVGDLTNKKHIQKLLDMAKGRPEEHNIKLGLLKSLKRAAYSPEAAGHYGLAKTDYCHFTSPIRRYADLIMHRSLEPLLVNPPEKTDRLPSKAHCAEIADHISDTERVSASAENESKRIKLLRWLEEMVDRQDPPVFRAVVTEVRAMGLLVEATEIMQRGVIKREALPGGNWRCEAHRGRYTSGDREIAVNDVIAVVVDDVNVERQFVDFRIEDEDGDGGPKKKGGRSKEARKPGGRPSRKSGGKSGGKSKGGSARKGNEKSKKKEGGTPDGRKSDGKKSSSRGGRSGGSRKRSSGRGGKSSGSNKRGRRSE